MQSVDTNVLARWILREDEVQAAIADTVMDGPVEITATVLVELGWVLTSVGGMNREQFANTMVSILSIDDALFADRDGLRWAVDRYRAGADWADMVHLVTTRHAAGFATFDRKLLRQAGASTPLPVVLLNPEPSAP
jgi:predicted nucleic-acid-binding protein